MSPVVVGIRMWCELASAGPGVDSRRRRHGATTDPPGPVPVPTPGKVPDPAAVPGPAPTPAMLPAGHADSGSGLSFTVHEFAELSDGREVILLDDRGWGMSRGRLSADELLAEVTVEEIERTVYLVLLPDWADVDHPLPPELAAVESSGGAQDWELLADRLRAFGVIATPAELLRVPRRVDLGDHLRARLTARAD